MIVKSILPPHSQQREAARTMFEPISATLIVRTLCSAYLLSSIFLLSLTLFGWWIIERIEHRDRSLPKWFS